MTGTSPLRAFLENEAFEGQLFYRGFLCPCLVRWQSSRKDPLRVFQFKFSTEYQDWMNDLRFISKE